AGRDGLESEALLFFTWADVTKLKGFAEVEGNAQQTEIMLKKLDQMGEFGDLRTCRRKYLLNYFSEEFDGDCGKCDNCTTAVETFDGTTIAQKALSAVTRTGQRFGITYLIDVLRGSSTVRDEHKNLKTYGIGSDVSKNDWFDHFKDLIARGYLAQSDGKYPTLMLTDSSSDVLAGRVTVQLAVPRKREDRVTKLTSADTTYEQPLFEELRRLRSVIARGENLPPYIVFSDATLIEMATWLPLDDADMRRIMGVGDLKMQKYGRDFLAEVRKYCTRLGLTSRAGLKQSSRARKRRVRGPDSRSTFEISLDLFREGRSIEDIARIRDLTTNTIQGHLALFIPAGKVKLEELCSQDKVEPIRDAVFKHGTAALGPIKTELGEEFTYGEIRAVIASMQ
ncbi:MAG: helix-turn-helix domain-containing protein, partial [Acidobacteria bacterium]|nr:helix-turn-helix domain-containing protein [Acidobacteriota bacterium]